MNPSTQRIGIASLVEQATYFAHGCSRALSLATILGLYTLIARSGLGAERPNFIIFIADDMAWDDCGAYGHPHIRTPNIDRLAEEGMRFDRAYLACSSCSPSRCAVMTGRYPHATGAGELHLPLPADKTIFTQPLKDAGYWTAAVGKWHLGEAVAEQVDYRAGASPEEMAKAWLTALAKRPANKPFMMWAAHSDPHRGYQRGAIDPPHTHADVVVPPFLPDTSEVRDDLALYYDEISRFDQHIGMVLGELDNLGIAENTLVAVMSDNGRPFPFCKTRVHVPGVRTPMIVRWPGHIPAGSVTRSVVSSIDIAPTILELAGLKPLSSFQGISFASILKNPQAITRTYAFAEHNWHDYRAFERGVHTSRYCYVRNWLPEYPGTPPADAVDSPTYKVMLERHRLGDLSPLQQDCIIAPRPSEFLYDVDADPNCVRNLAAEPGHAATLQVMRDQLSSWQAETADKFPGEDQLTPDGFDRQTGKRMIKGTHPALVK